MVASESFLVEKPEKTRQSNGSRRNDGNWWKTGSRAADRSSIFLTAGLCSGRWRCNQQAGQQLAVAPSLALLDQEDLINDQTDLPALADADTIIEH